MLDSLIEVLRAHPAASTLLMDGPSLSPSHWRATELTLAILRGAGFDAQHAAEIARAALWTGLMLVMSEPGFDPGLPASERAELQRRKQVELASLPPGQYPHLIEAAVPLTACDNPAFHYRFGVDLFVAGVQALAPSASGTSG